MNVMSFPQKEQKDTMGEVPTIVRPWIREPLDRLPSRSRAQSVLDLMDGEGGRRWWKEHGITMPLTFDLTRRSRSWEVFGCYLRERTVFPQK